MASRVELRKRPSMMAPRIWAPWLSVEALILLWSGSVSVAETIYLRNGQKREAPIMTRTEQSVTIDWYGVPVTYWAGDIERIEGARMEGPSPGDPGAFAQNAPRPSLEDIAAAGSDQQPGQAVPLGEDWKELLNRAERAAMQGEAARAESFCQEAVRLAARTFGANRPQVALALSVLADLYFRQGRSEEAQAILRQAQLIAQEAWRRYRANPSGAAVKEVTDALKQTGSLEAAGKVLEAAERAEWEKAAIATVRAMMVSLEFYAAIEEYDPRTHAARYPATLTPIVVDGLPLDGLTPEGLSGIAGAYRFTYQPSEDRLGYAIRAETLTPGEHQRVITADSRGTLALDGVVLDD